MPINYKKYPSNWRKIREDILKRAGNKCEFCGVENYSVGIRDINGDFWKLKDASSINSDEGIRKFGDNKIIKIILTIAHLDHNIENNNYKNLKALCQKCHLNYDKELHKKNRYLKKNNYMTLF